MHNPTRYDFLLAVVVGFSGVALLVMRASKRRLPYPPGPKRLPVVGNLFSMPSQEEWVAYRKWSEKLGSDIIHADVMGSHIVILNSTKVANELLEKRSSIYSDRPHLVVLQELFGMDYHIGLVRYGPAWRHSRREFQAYLGPADLKEYQPLEQRAVHRLLRNSLSSPDNFVQHFRHMAGQVILSIAYGIDVLPENDPYVADAENLLRAAVTSTTREAMLLNFVPWLIKMPSWFPGARYKRYAREWYPIVVGAVKTTYDKVKSELAYIGRGNGHPLRRRETHIENSTEDDIWVARAVPASMYLGGADTTVSALQTFTLAMILYPDVQRKAQAEIDRVVGNSRLPDFSDQDALPYVQAVLKEVSRWHPVTPLGAPRKVIVSDIYEGYYIPAGSIIIPNVWGMMHDPAVFPEPDQVFGFGARQCPGRILARASIWSNMVGILAAFNITPAEDGPLEEAYTSGAITIFKVCEAIPVQYPTAFGSGGVLGASYRE
ncbi:cytochrome P450 [Lactarius vividus]|nr:cytochrome P450 [Lactarius vividus]